MSTKDKITQSALETFYTKGFHATGVEQLSKEANITKRTLYHHFENKDELIKATLDLRDEQFMAKLANYVDKLESKLKPAGYIDFIAKWVKEPSFNGCYFINASAEYSKSNEEPHKLAKKHKDELRKYLEGICKNAQIEEYKFIANQLFILGEGLIVSSQVCGANKETIDATKNMAKILLQN
jgi:AcrR family transcriptional regulator